MLEIKVSTDVLMIYKECIFPIILNLIQIFIGMRQRKKDKAKFKSLAAEFKMESYKLILNNFAGFSKMTLYPLPATVNK